MVNVQGISPGRVLVVGLGISGMATALRLHGLGWDTVIVERAPARRTGGYFIATMGTGQAAAKRLGIFDDLPDRTPTADQVQKITKDSKVSTVWTWPDRPGVAGCAAVEGTVLVNLVNTKQTVAVRLASDTGAVTGDPEVLRDGQHGHAWALRLSPDGNVWGATVNRTIGDPDKTDDVVFPLFPEGGFPRSDADKT